MAVCEFRIEGSGGMPIRGNLHLPGDDAPAGGALPLVVFVHGFKGFKDWGCWPPLCDKLAEYGMAALRFDLSHNGVGDDGVDFSALDRFERNTVSREVEDTLRVLAAVNAGRLGDLELPAIGGRFLLGHSRGGGVVLQAAVETTSETHGALAGVVTWSAICRFEREWAPEQIAAWEREESVPIRNARTKQDMPIGPDYARDLAKHRDRFDLERGVATLAERDVPLCIVHGTKDTSVPPDEAITILGWAEAAGHKRARVHTIDGANHTFNSVHPWQGFSPELESAFGQTLAFLREHA